MSRKNGSPTVAVSEAMINLDKKDGLSFSKRLDAVARRYNALQQSCEIAPDLKIRIVNQIVPIVSKFYDLEQLALASPFGFCDQIIDSIYDDFVTAYGGEYVEKMEIALKGFSVERTIVFMELLESEIAKIKNCGSHLPALGG
jgi:hypothetical protein